MSSTWNTDSATAPQVITENSTQKLDDKIDPVLMDQNEPVAREQHQDWRKGHHGLNESRRQVMPRSHYHSHPRRILYFPCSPSMRFCASRSRPHAAIEDVETMNELGESDNEHDVNNGDENKAEVNEDAKETEANENDEAAEENENVEAAEANENEDSSVENEYDGEAVEYETVDETEANENDETTEENENDEDTKEIENLTHWYGGTEPEHTPTGPPHCLSTRSTGSKPPRNPGGFIPHSSVYVPYDLRLVVVVKF